MKTEKNAQKKKPEAKGRRGVRRKTGERSGTHYDALPHSDCLDPAHCDCECRACKAAWLTAGRPSPAKAAAQALSLVAQLKSARAEIARLREDLAAAEAVCAEGDDVAALGHGENCPAHGYPDAQPGCDCGASKFMRALAAWQA